jgi:hypothetical protein
MGRRPPQPEAKYFDDCEVADSLVHVTTGDDETPYPNALTKKDAPEPLKRVRVLEPFLVSHEGKQYWANDIAEVPLSVASHWIKSRWCAEA